VAYGDVPHEYGEIQPRRAIADHVLIGVAGLGPGHDAVVAGGAYRNIGVLGESNGEIARLDADLGMPGVEASPNGRGPSLDQTATDVAHISQLGCAGRGTQDSQLLDSLAVQRATGHLDVDCQLGVDTNDDFPAQPQVLEVLGGAWHLETKQPRQVGGEMSFADDLDRRSPSTPGVLSLNRDAGDRGVGDESDTSSGGLDAHLIGNWRAGGRLSRCVFPAGPGSALGSVRSTGRGHLVPHVRQSLTGLRRHLGPPVSQNLAGR